MALTGHGIGVPSCSLGPPRTAGPVAFRPQCSRVPHPGAHTSPELRHPHPAFLLFPGPSIQLGRSLCRSRVPDATLQPPTPSENASFSPLFCSDDKLRRRRPSSRTHLTSAVSPRHLHPAKPQPRFSPTTHLFHTRSHTPAHCEAARGCADRPAGHSRLTTHRRPALRHSWGQPPIPQARTGFSPLSLPVSRSPLPLIPPPQSLAVDLLPNSRSN